MHACNTSYCSISHHDIQFFNFFSVSHVEESLSLSEVSELSSLYNLAPSPTPTLVEQTMMEMDQLSEQETRDLLVSVLFVLKYLDIGEALS